jgi:hypothetical protein
MMTPTDGLNAMIAGFALLLFWIVFAFLYRDYRVDAFRQQMFAVRDEMFDYAADGEIDFDDPAYVLVRTTMNGFIRFADRMNLVSVIVVAWATAGEEIETESFSTRYKEAVATLTEEQRATLDRFVNRMNAYAAEHVIFSSLVLSLALVPLALALVLKRASKEAGRRFVRRAVPERLSGAVDSLALSYGAV